MALVLAERGAYISPVWYQLRSDDKQVLTLTGGHDYDGDWIRDLRLSSSPSQSCAVSGYGTRVPRIVPRVLWEIEGMPSRSHQERIAALLSKELHAKSYDGFVVEIPLTRDVISILRAVRKALPKAILILALPSWQMPEGRWPSQYHVQGGILDLCAGLVDRLVIMTYDYARTPSGVPNAPLPWVKSVVDALVARSANVSRILLLGIPLYGYVEGEAILSPDIVSAARASQQSASVTWNSDWAEHVVTYVEGQRRTGTLPTHRFIMERQSLARAMGLPGVAYWEVGQVLQCLEEVL